MIKKNCVVLLRDKLVVKFLNENILENFLSSLKKRVDQQSVEEDQSIGEIDFDDAFVV